MAVTYSVVQRTNPKDNMAEPKWYAQGQRRYLYDIDRLCADIEKASSMTRGDIRSVILDALDFIKQRLAEGCSVQLGELGSFSVALQSIGADTEEAFDAAHISSARVAFRQGRELKEMCRGLQYEKVSVRPHV